MNAPERYGTTPTTYDVSQWCRGENSDLDDEIADAAHYLSSRLAEFSLTPGCRVGVLGSGHFPSVVAAKALTDLGAKIVLLDADTTVCAITARLRSLGVEFLVAHDAVEVLFDEVVDAMHYGEVPSVVAEEFALVRIAPRTAGQSVDVRFVEGVLSGRDRNGAHRRPVFVG